MATINVYVIIMVKIFTVKYIESSKTKKHDMSATLIVRER